MTTEQFIDVPLIDIQPNSRQPRTVFKPTALTELADSIRVHGIKQPLRVMFSADPGGAKYTLIMGERRWRAAALAGLTSVPCVIEPTEPDAQQLLEWAVIENVQREDLTVADQARAYQRLHAEFCLTDEAIGQRVGKSRSDVTTTRNLFFLPADVINRIGDGDGQLPKRIVRQLLPLANAVEPDRLIKLASQIAALKPGSEETPEDAIYEVLESNAQRLPNKNDGWNLVWPGKPIEVTDEQGAFAVVACKGCPAVVHAQLGYRKGDYCTNVRCFEAKTSLFVECELQRVSKKFSLPVAGADETVYTVPLNYSNTDQARKWLSSPPEHLRLRSKSEAEDAGKLDAYQHKELLGSPVLALVSTLKEPFNSKTTAAVGADGAAQPETDVQRQKRIAAEEREARDKRLARGAVRKSRADVAWLAQNTARLAAPQIAISGPALDFVAWFVDDRARIYGQWPAVYTALDANKKALTSAKGKEREPLLRERVILKLLYEKIPDYSNDWELNWTKVADRIAEIITERASDDEECALGLKLPAGWNVPPIHQTPSSCWHCGKFTPNAEMTQVDRADGWSTASIGSGRDGLTLKDVSCPECSKEKRDKVQAEHANSIGKSKPAPRKAGKPAAKAAKK